MRDFRVFVGRAARFGALALLLVGCAPLVGGGSWLFGLAVCAAASVLMLVSAPGAAQAEEPPQPTQHVTPAGPQPGPPAPRPKCSGWEHKSCSNYGTIQISCCPKNAKCNYAYAPYVECAHGTCVRGKDPGMCKAPQPIIDPSAKTKADCRGHWAKACVSGTVTESCIMPVPTNYMGPPRNPRFHTCDNDRCTTSNYREVCYPAKAEAKTCKQGWTKSCYQGKITERCIPEPPTNYSGNFYGTTQFVDCGEGRCAIGTEKKACVR